MTRDASPLQDMMEAQPFAGSRCRLCQRPEAREGADPVCLGITIPTHVHSQKDQKSAKVGNTHPSRHICDTPGADSSCLPGPWHSCRQSKSFVLQCQLNNKAFSFQACKLALCPRLVPQWGMLHGQDLQKALQYPLPQLSSS